MTAARARLVRAARAPGVHFLVVGALLFAASAFLDASRASRDGSGGPGVAADHGPIVVSARRVDEVRRDFLTTFHRQPTAAEIRAKVREMVDEELLFRHALDLGLLDQEPVHRRLEQIATFVSADAPGDDPVAAEQDLVREALALGLHRDDLVVRRILVDSAQRLIRAAVESREPSDDALAAYLREHPERFRRDEEIALEWRPADDAAEAGEALPPLGRRDLARKFGRAFVDALDPENAGAWQGPVPSTYGPLEVRVTWYAPERTAMLSEVRDRVRAELVEVLADRWLAERLDRLRAGTTVVLPPPAAMELADHGTIAGGTS